MPYTCASAGAAAMVPAKISTKDRTFACRLMITPVDLGVAMRGGSVGQVQPRFEHGMHARSGWCADAQRGARPDHGQYDAVRADDTSPRVANRTGKVGRKGDIFESEEHFQGWAEVGAEGGFTEAGH